MSYLIIREKVDLNFFTWRIVFFFQKFVFSTDSWVSMKWFYNFHHKCKITFRSLIKRYSIFATVGIRWKSWQNVFFFNETIAFILQKKIGSIDFLGPRGMILNLAQKLPKKCVALKNFPWGLPYSVVQEKRGLNLFSSHGEKPSFEQFFYQPLRS